MSLALPDHWLWDFWFAQDGPDVHAFFLCAPRARRPGAASPQDAGQRPGQPWSQRRPRGDRARVVAEGGTHYLVARSKLGRYVLDRDAFLVGDPTSRYHAGRLLHHRGSWHFFAWQHLDDHGRSWGVLSDSMPLTIHRDGSLSVQVPVAG